MKEIANLARIVTLRRTTNRPLLDLDSAQPGKEERLLQAIVASPNATVAQLTKMLYGSNSSTSQMAMRKLRARVQDKLLNHLLFLDNSDPRLLVSRRYELECIDLLHKATTLYLEGEYQLSERLLRRCMRLAQESDFTMYAELATQRLRIIYAEQSQQYKYKSLDKQLAALRQQLEWEREAEQIALDVRLIMLHTVAKRRAMLPKIFSYLTRLQVLHGKANSFNTFIALYRLRLSYAELLGQYGE
ncbi:MAG: hypothetical protein EOO61_17905 [Hymenobacter sp.]|nr:MAG: hypothetical protein EOO61_17905 [Hymenobacter sp.]